jgi:prophage regulatory protein
MQETYLADSQVGARFSVHRSTIWRWAKTDPNFPNPIRLGRGCARWRLSELEKWEQQLGGPSGPKGRS